MQLFGVGRQPPNKTLASVFRATLHLLHRLYQLKLNYYGKNIVTRVWDNVKVTWKQYNL